MKPWIEIVLRSASLFFITLILIRIVGKRGINRITPFQYINYTVIAILTALISANIITNLAYGFIALGIWVIMPLIIDVLSMKSKKIHDIINGKGIVIIKNGKVMEENLKKVRLTAEELLSELRTKDAFNLADVEFAVMEPPGYLNILKKADKMAVTPHDLEKKLNQKGEPQTVILDGNILDESLSNMSLNRSWLQPQLDGMGISLDNVFIGQVDSSGDLYLDLFDDSIQTPQPKVKELLYANLEKIQADLLKYSIDTENEKWKKVYSEDAKQLKKVIDDLKPYLLH